MTRQRAARGLATTGVLLLVFLAGCAVDEDGGEPTAEEVRRCLGFGPSDARGDTPSVGGDGPREVSATVFGVDGRTLPGVPVAAWWNTSAAGPEGILLVTDASGNATFKVRASTDIRLLSSSTDQLVDHDVWDMHGWVAAGTGTARATVVGLQVASSFEGTWTEPVSVGAQEPVWRSFAFDWAEAGSLALLVFLEVVLTWTNGAQGGADFGTAVGTVDGFRYWNQEYQTSVGEFSETLRFDREELEEHGWTSGTQLRAGPSISTGGFALTGIPFGLTWTAAFEPATLPCGPAAD